MIFHQPRLAELAIFAALLRLPGTAPYTIPESVPLKKKINLNNSSTTRSLTKSRTKQNNSTQQQIHGQTYNPICHPKVPVVTPSPRDFPAVPRCQSSVATNEGDSARVARSSAWHGRIGHFRKNGENHPFSLENTWGPFLKTTVGYGKTWQNTQTRIKMKLSCAIS